METRDRLANLGLFAAAALAWVAVGLIVVSRDPVLDPGAGLAGAVAIGLAVGLTAVPLLWLAVFARHGRIAYRGDWSRAVRRGGWVAGVVALFVALRLQGALQAPIALFVVAMVAIAEATLSADR
ncbi:MAG: hypothetical protein ACOYXS_03950 [Chloroflexota bacterium]